MRSLILIFWIFAGTVERSALQPSRNVSALQNVSVEGEFWAEPNSFHLRQHTVKDGEEEKSGPRTWVSATAVKNDGLHSERVMEKEERALREEVGWSVGQRGGSDEKNKWKRADDETDTERSQTVEDKTGDSEGGRETFNDPEKYSNESKEPAVVGSEDLYRSGPQTTVHQIHNQRTTPPSWYTESGSAKPRPEEKGHASLTPMAAKAGHTAARMPGSFRTEPHDGITEAMAVMKRDTVVKKHRGKEEKTKALNKGRKVKWLKQGKDSLSMTMAPFFPYFKDNYCPPACVCYGRVVQCSDKNLDKIPYGIPYNSRYILLMNNQIDGIAVGLLPEYLSMEFLVLTNNRLTDGSIKGTFEGIPNLKRLHLERNVLQSVPADLPSSLEELRLDGNRVEVMTEAAWAHCPGLLILSLSNNSLGSGSSPLPAGVLSPLGSLRTLSLSHNRLTSVPLHLPLSLQELYLRGNLIQRFQGGVFQGKAELQVLDLSANRLTNKGLDKTALINATHLESLNLEGNFFRQIPQHLPRSLKTLNLEGNSISTVSKAALLSLPHLEHLGLAHNKIARVSPGSFRMLPLLHQLDLSHNALRQVPRQLPPWLVSITLTHNKIRTVPRDAFCWAGHTEAPYSQLARVELENNLVDMGRLDSQAFSCLRGSQVVHFY
uniref:Wu:fc23c09 n=1 Tax=Electrophorus electricus TaxID=8005 RepID=A0A4W4FVT7_ELEEL